MIRSCSVISVLISHLQLAAPGFFCDIFLCQDSPGALKLEVINQTKCWSECGCAPFRVSEKVRMDRCYCCIFARGRCFFSDQLIPVLMTDGLKGINDDMMLPFALSCSWHSLHQAISSVFGAIYLHMIHACVYYMHVYALQFHHRKSLDIQLGHLAGSLLLAAGHPATPRVAVPQAPMAIAPIAPQAG